MRIRTKKVGLLILLTVIFTGMGYAQDDVQFTLFPWTTSYYNAGGIGEQSNTLCFTLLYNNKYLGWKEVFVDENGKEEKVNSSPQDFFVNVESYLKKLHGSLGLTLIHDQLGAYKNTGVKLGYSFKLRIGGGHLGIGLQASMYNQQIDNGYFRPIEDGDAVISGLSESTLDLDFNFGLLYKTDQWYVGASVTQLASAFDKNQKLRLSGDLGSHRTPQLYVHGGYTWIVPSNPNWELIPQTLLKTDLKTVQWDMMVLARYNGVFWGGLSYRIQDAVSVVFGARPFYNSSNIYLKGLDAGLSYGFTTNSLGYRQHRSFGDIEIMIRYCFDIYKPEVFSGYGNSRYIYKNRY